MYERNIIVLVKNLSEYMYIYIHVFYFDSPYEKKNIKGKWFCIINSRNGVYILHFTTDYTNLATETVCFRCHNSVNTVAAPTTYFPNKLFVI